MLGKELMKKAHILTKEIKKEYDNINYHFQLGICIKYLLKEERYNLLLKKNTNRRTKTELELAGTIIKNFLDDNNNNARQSWNACTKFYIENKIELPYFIKGLKDFIRVSKKYKKAYEYKKQLEQRKRDDKQLEKLYIDKIYNMTSENDYQKVKEQFYTSDNEDIKMALCDLMWCIKDTDKRNWIFNANHIRIFKKLNLV